MSVKKF